MSRFEFIETPLRGLWVVRRLPLRDARGFLERTYAAEELGHLTGGRHIVHINHTMTRAQGVVRGMHFQHPPDAETKLISCLRGEVFDVAIDLRAGSPTFLRWHAQTLSAENALTMCIPEGFAHGFQTLSENCEMLYLHTAPYVPASEGGVAPTEPRVGIAWPLPIASMSEKDARRAPLLSAFTGIQL